jgi:urease accessory protein
MRCGRPWCFTNLRSGEGLDRVEAFLLAQLPQG